MADGLDALGVSELRTLLTAHKGDLVRRARSSGLKPGDARRTSGASAGAGPSSSGGGGASQGARPTAARPDATSGARGANDGTPKERELVGRILRTKDYYELLGVPRNADEDALKKAYRKLVLQIHPDKCRAAKAEEAFKYATKAFDTLSDANMRDTYDRHGPEAVDGAPRMHNPFAGFGGGGGGGMGGFPFPGGFAGGGMGAQGADIDDLLRNLFGSGGAFGNGGGYGYGGTPRARPRQQQGQPGQQQAGGQQAGGGGGGGGAHAEGGGFSNPLAGMNLAGLLPVLPVVLMLLGQFISVVPFLFRNLQLFMVLWYACPQQHRSMLLRAFAAFTFLQMFIL